MALATGLTSPDLLPPKSTIPPVTLSDLYILATKPFTPWEGTTTSTPCLLGWNQEHSTMHQVEASGQGRLRSQAAAVQTA